MTKREVKKVDAISADTMVAWKNLSSQVGEIESKILERIDYIVSSVFKLFDEHLETWYFYGAAEGEIGNLERAIRGNEIYLIIETEPHRYSGSSKEMVILLKDGSEWGLNEGSIPIHWLYEDFEEELVEGKIKYEAQQKEKELKKKKAAEQRKLKKETDKKLAAVAKKKLTKEELAALKANL